MYRQQLALDNLRWIDYRKGKVETKNDFHALNFSNLEENFAFMYGKEEQRKKKT